MAQLAALAMVEGEAAEALDRLHREVRAELVEQATVLLARTPPRTSVMERVVVREPDPEQATRAEPEVLEH